MFSASQQQASQQWDTITPQLREALFSDVNADLVWNLCQAEHLSKEKSYQVAELAGYVLFGFIRPEDLSEELVNSLELSLESAKKISDGVNLKIFTPLRADIDKASTTAPNGKGDFIGPKIIQNSSSTAAPVSMPPMPLQNLSGIGWSKTKPVASVIPTPAPLSTIVSSIPKPPSPSISPMGEFERMKPSVVPQPLAAPTPAIAPIILQQEMPAVSAAQKNADFHITKSNNSAQMEFSTEKEKIKVMPAVIEFNRNISEGVKTSAAPLPAPAPSRVGAVNYTEFKSSLASIPVIDSGARKVTEITSTTPTVTATPVAPIAPIPQTPPAPPIVNKTPVPVPTPPQSVAKKVIVQDFLQESPK